MNRILTGSLTLLFSFALAAPAIAHCRTCYWPPPFTAPSCGDTDYDAGTGCIISNTYNACDSVGECDGPLGECTRDCEENQWACGKPLLDTWRVASLDQGPVAKRNARHQARRKG